MVGEGWEREVKDGIFMALGPSYFHLPLDCCVVLCGYDYGMAYGITACVAALLHMKLRKEREKCHRREWRECKGEEGGEGKGARRGK